jgi:hypothetical protein
MSRLRSLFDISESFDFIFLLSLFCIFYICLTWTVVEVGSYDLGPELEIWFMNLPLC